MPSKNKVTVTTLPGKQEPFITREFDASRELVYKAHIDPDLYVQWLGSHGYEMILEALPDNRTKATIHSVFQSVSDRDGMIQNGMEKGVSEGYERLDDILEAM